jgi:tRNA (guanine37-N1)-methyltransferase
MKIDVITLFPEMFTALTDFGVVGRAVKKGIVALQCWNPRDYAEDRHRTVDDRPYGGGPGMVMMVEPMVAAIRAAKAASNHTARCIYLSPQGRPVNQAALQDFAGQQHLIFVAGRYEGIDERIIELEVDEEWSVGDYVLSGGEIAAMAVIDGTARLLPEVLGHDESAAQDSFSESLLDCPHYTRPEEIENLKVPDVLLSGDHKAIERWRRKQAIGRTWLRRPDLLELEPLNENDAKLLQEFKNELNS